MKANEPRDPQGARRARRGRRRRLGRRAARGLGGGVPRGADRLLRRRQDGQGDPAGVEAGILAFNAESERELEKIDEIARHARAHRPGRPARQSRHRRRSHPYISTGLKQNKFGVDSRPRARDLPQARPLPARPPHRAPGPHRQPDPGGRAARRDRRARSRSSPRELMAADCRSRRSTSAAGIGVGETEETSLAPEAYAAAVLPALAGLPRPHPDRAGPLDRGAAGALVTRVLYVKEAPRARTSSSTDAAMNDLLRPALYSASHPIEPVVPRGAPFTADIVGPVCETGDFFVRDATIARPEEGDLLAIRNAGAYGFAMSSNYNFRGRAPPRCSSRTAPAARAPPRDLRGPRAASSGSRIRNAPIRMRTRSALRLAALLLAFAHRSRPRPRRPRYCACPARRTSRSIPRRCSASTSATSASRTPTATRGLPRHDAPGGARERTAST